MFIKIMYTTNIVIYITTTTTNNNNNNNININNKINNSEACPAPATNHATESLTQGRLR